jgi:putative two-component system response regulator
VITTLQKTILVVDDADESRRSSQALVESLGYRCVTADGGDTAIELGRQFDPHLVLLDVRMPGMDGYETARAYREKISQETPIVMLTALNGVETRVRSIQAGANDVLTKPTERALLEVRIQSLIHQIDRVKAASASHTVALSLIKAMETKSKHTSGHARRTGLWSGKLAEEFGFGPERIAIIEVAGMLHDVGKIGIPDLILDKPATLTDDENLVMRNHPVLGEIILKSGPADPIVVQSARNHHERMDGRGYPDGRPAIELPLEVRIVQVADVFDAMTSRRPYQSAAPPEKAIDLLRQGADEGQLDGGVVEKLVNLVREGRIYRAFHS